MTSAGRGYRAVFHGTSHQRNEEAIAGRVSLFPPFSLPGDVNENALGSKTPQNAQNRVEIGCDYTSLDPAQVAALDVRGSCKLELGLALAETHRADGRTKGRR
jgi:hypothetical protein